MINKYGTTRHYLSQYKCVNVGEDGPPKYLWKAYSETRLNNPDDGKGCDRVIESATVEEAIIFAHKLNLVINNTIH